jgi:hypothetical protein
VSDLSRGLTYVAVPPGFPASGLDHPEWGQGMVSRRQSNEALADLIGAADPRLVVVEDPLMRPTDPVFERWAGECFIFQTEVYRWCLCPDAAAAAQFVSGLTDYPLNAVVARWPQTFGSAQQVTREELLRLATSTESVIVGAYDNEGYIVWQPPGREP